MGFNTEEVAKKLGTPEGRRELLSHALTGEPHLANATRVASQLELAESMFVAGRTVDDAVRQSATGLVDALKGHGQSLVAAPAASDKNSRSFTRATWFLFFATCGLLIVAGVQVWLVLRSG